MGYLLRGLRIASYLAVVLGVILTYGGLLTAGKEELFSYGVGVIFLGLLGIAATSWLRNRYLWGTEVEEYQSLVAASDSFVKRRKHINSRLGALLGGIAGFIGVMVGGFATTIVLMMQTEARGYDADGMEYIFAVVCFWPFPFGAPLLGALLGALGGYLTSFVFRRAVVAVLVGFVIGVLVGVIAIIGFIDMQTILELWQ